MVIPKDGAAVVNLVDPVCWSSSGRGSTRVAIAIVPPVITGYQLQMYPLGMVAVPISPDLKGCM